MLSLIWRSGAASKESLLLSRQLIRLTALAGEAIVCTANDSLSVTGRPHAFAQSNSHRRMLATTQQESDQLESAALEDILSVTSSPYISRRQLNRPPMPPWTPSKDLIKRNALPRRMGHLMQAGLLPHTWQDEALACYVAWQKSPSSVGIFRFIDIWWLLPGTWQGAGRGDSQAETVPGI